MPMISPASNLIYYPTGTLHFSEIKNIVCVVPHYNLSQCQISSRSIQLFKRERVTNHPSISSNITSRYEPWERNSNQRRKLTYTRDHACIPHKKWDLNIPANCRCTLVHFCLTFGKYRRDSMLCYTYSSWEACDDDDASSKIFVHPKRPQRA